MYYVEQKHREYSTMVSGTSVVLKDATQKQLKQLYNEGNPYVKYTSTPTIQTSQASSKKGDEPLPKQTKTRTKRSKRNKK